MLRMNSLFSDASIISSRIVNGEGLDGGGKWIRTAGTDLELLDDSRRTACRTAVSEFAISSGIGASLNRDPERNSGVYSRKSPPGFEDRSTGGVHDMSFWKPDQTFYPSPRMAMQGPQEKLGYVAVFNPEPKNGRHDAMCVLDLDPTSPTYSQIVGRTEMPGVGDELHHFGWNAC